MPQPAEAERGQRDGRRRLHLAEVARYASAALLVVILVAGYWKPHPLASLAPLAVVTVVWWPVLRQPSRARWLFFYVGGIYLYTVLRAVVDDITVDARTDYVIAVDRLLFFGNVPSVELQRPFFSPRNVGALDVWATAVHWSFFIVPHAVFGYLWVRRPRLAAVYGAAVLLTLYVGLVLFWLLPTTPPWLASREGDLTYAYRVMDYVTRGLDHSTYEGVHDTLAEPNVVAAVPSIHMALTFLVLIAAREAIPRLQWPVGIYNVAMAFSLVYLGEHYVFDVIAGVLVAALSFQVVRVRWRRVHRATLAPEPPVERAA